MLPLNELIEQSQALNKDKKHSEVIELLSDEVLAVYQNADLYMEKAEAYFRIMEKELCYKIVEKVLNVDSNNAKAKYFIGNKYFELKEYNKALDTYNKALETSPEFAFLYNGLGNVYNELNENDNAYKAYNKAIEIDSNFAFPYHGLGMIYRKLKDYNKAIESYKKAIEIDPKFSYPYNGLGNIYYELKEYQKAIIAFKNAIEIDPKLKYPHNGLGLVYRELNDYKNAIKAYQKAIEIDPKYIKSLNGLGNVYSKIKDYNNAIETYQKAIEIDSEYADPYYNIALVYYKLKEYPAALYNFEMYIKLTELNEDYFTAKSKSKVAELKKIIKNNDYHIINELVDKIKEILLFEENCVTHYTSLSVVKFLILDKSKFRLSEATFLNDTSEGRELFKFLPTFNSTLIKTIDTVALPFTKKPFIGSFVAQTRHDDLSLWRMYGKENKEEAKGCAITLDRSELLENLKETFMTDGDFDTPIKSDQEFCFYRVAYKVDDKLRPFIIPGAQEKENKLNKHMFKLRKAISDVNSNQNNDMNGIQEIIELLNSIAYLFKSADYQYENELRLVIEGVSFKKIIDAESNLPKVYVELTPIFPFINKITLGPKVERADEWASTFYYSLDKYDIHPEILISHLPFK